MALREQALTNEGRDRRISAFPSREGLQPAIETFPRHRGHPQVKERRAGYELY